MVVVGVEVNDAPEQDVRRWGRIGGNLTPPGITVSVGQELIAIGACSE